MNDITYLLINKQGEVIALCHNQKQALQQLELKKIEYHLSIATDTNLNDQDVGG